MRRQGRVRHVVLIAVAVAVACYCLSNFDVDLDRMKRLVLEAVGVTLQDPRQWAWRAWEEALATRDKLVNEAVSLAREWDGRDRSTVQQIIVRLERTVAVVSSSDGPPGAPWYRDGIAEYDRKHLRAWQLILEALNEKDAYYAELKLYQAGILADEAEQFFAALMAGYQGWLTTHGPK